MPEPRLRLYAEIRAFAETQWARPSVQTFVRHPRPPTLPPAYWTLPWNLPPAPPARAGDLPGVEKAR